MRQLGREPPAAADNLQAGSHLDPVADGERAGSLAEG
jgi:hypothetical protein